MSGLLYRPDVDQVRQRLTTWWHGGDIGRPVMMLYYPRTTPLEKIEELPPQPDFSPPYDLRYLKHRVNWAWRAASESCWLGEIIPYVSPDVAPNGTALYLGCKGVLASGTVWVEPCITDPDAARFEFDPDNFYWQMTLRLTHALAEMSRGRFRLHFPGLLEGLDALAGMRGTEALLFDLVERPEWVSRSVNRITDLYFRYYDRLYDLIRDEIGGSMLWLWAPGRMTRLQCDFSAMIGPDHYKQFMVPVLTEISERVSYSFYHLDGPAALVHTKHILSVPRISIIQWEPGAGNPRAPHRTWWPLFHDVLDAGKKVYISCGTLDELRDLKREFGRELNRFMLVVGMPSKEAADEAMSIVTA